MAERTVIRPQPGPQTQFLTTKADIAIYGGSAGGGKSFALVMDPLRYVSVPHFDAVIFRKTTVQVTNAGGLWDESSKLYPYVGGQPREHKLWWNFPIKQEDGQQVAASVSFSHLEHDKDAYEHQGAQYAFIGFDELTHFSPFQFWYLVSRNRSTCGVKPYIRATCNPDPDSFVRELIDWWIDPDTGLAIPERAGVLRWFVRLGDEMMWADNPAELAQYVDNEGQPIPPKSLTFIPAKLSDNKLMNQKDPNYRANLMALPKVERERLLYGNWNIRPSAGLLFQRAWCKVVDAAPADLDGCRGWDLAGTPKTSSNDPDWTSGTMIGRSRSTGRFIVLDHRKTREAPAGVERYLVNTASEDGRMCAIELPQDPGSAGKSWGQALVKLLLGYNVRLTPESGDKETRFRAFSAQAEAGNVDILRGPWNKAFFDELEGFPDGRHDDVADSTSRALNHFVQPMKGAGSFELMRQEALGIAAANEQSKEPPRPQYQPGSVEWLKAINGD